MAAAGAAACARLTAALPARLERLARRPTRPPSTRTRAWGSPPVVLRCGVGVPPGFNAGSQVVEVDGVTWYQHLGAKAVGWTTVGVPVRVSLTVPASYADQGAFLVDLAGPISRTLPPTASAAG